MKGFLLLTLLLAASSTAHAIVIRHDVDDAQYRVPATEFPALVDMPGEGHGALIAPQWVVTAAHTLPMHADLKQVVINGPNRTELRRAFNRITSAYDRWPGPGAMGR